MLTPKARDRETSGHRTATAAIVPEPPTARMYGTISATFIPVWKAGTVQENISGPATSALSTLAEDLEAADLQRE
ncbi:hypothetical protein TrCOL_g9383 [Triparma columacea]|uniref:Uncharacterized protein n=1 Tax=Triparma columacea TaxID=722753 RepID=A0A9W7FXJ0_9STRA|nr:hypothetical protein TrCOL_g9383 [Triparma columacea]